MCSYSWWTIRWDCCLYLYWLEKKKHIYLTKKFLGWVFGLTTEPLNSKPAGGGSGGQDMAPQLKVKVQQMQWVLI